MNETNGVWLARILAAPLPWHDRTTVIGSVGLSLIVDLVAKTTIILGIALIPWLMARRASAAARHVILLSGVILAAIIPATILTADLAANPMFSDSRWDIPITMPMPHATVKAPVDPYNFPRPGTTRMSPISANPPMPFSPDANVRYPLFAFSSSTAAAGFTLSIAWVIVGAILLLRYLIGYTRLLFISTRARRVDDPRLTLFTADYKVDFRQSRAVSAPSMWGWRRGTILLPPDALDWPDDRLRSVIAHEVAHLRRGDWLFGMITQIVCAINWYNPLAWIVTRLLSREAEFACDDMVLLSGSASSTGYAQDLLDIARDLNGGPRLPEAIAIATTSDVGRRIASILDGGRRRGVKWVVAAAALVLAIVAAWPAGALRLYAKPPRYPVITGTVLDQNGKPAADAEVYAKFGSDATFETDSDAAGRFTLRAMQEQANPDQFAGPQGTIVFARKGDAGTPSYATVCPGSHPTLRLAPHMLGYVDGGVVDIAGKPIAGATVNGSVYPYPQRSYSMLIEPVVSDTHGRFRFGPVWMTSDCAISAGKSGFLSANVRDNRGAGVLHVPAGSTVSLPLTRLTPAKSFVDGLLVDENGRPLAHATLALDANILDDEALTDVQGHFHVVGVPAGPVLVQIITDKEYKPITLTAGTTGNRVVAIPQ